MGRIWTKEEEDVVRQMYADHYADEIAQKLGRSRCSIHTRAASLGLKASKERIVESGRRSSKNPNVIASQFKKGSVPANKGKKMSPKQYAKCARTMFKKGHSCSNHREVGSERVNAEGYVEIKVAEPNKWRLKHRVVWEQSNGKIPPGCNIQFRNGNKLDIRIENLYMITRAEQLKKENSMYARYPEELRQVIRLKGAIKRQITEFNKKQNGKQSKS